MFCAALFVCLLQTVNGCVGPSLIVVEVNASVRRIEGARQDSSRPVEWSEESDTNVRIISRRDGDLKAGLVRPELTN